MYLPARNMRFDVSLSAIFDSGDGFAKESPMGEVLCINLKGSSRLLVLALHIQALVAGG